MCCGLSLSPEPASGVDLDTLFDQDLLLARVEDSVEISEERLSDTRELIEVVGYIVPVSKKGYVDMVQQLDEVVKDARQKSIVDRRKVTEFDRMVKELSLKVQLLADDS